ncbi:hypothetical protein [Rhizobium sp. Root1220]|uniref:hypothetical protein n=1 Tax=Rhizobium sp. Root1220 TaxID=1736432 RepID=UPI0006FC2855|nr:hypothetical protein [Rhizobium sp. Root1220]KQV65216.1 hypothetical protein ASC90_15145 [Rhizobium sp. Root1220]
MVIVDILMSAAVAATLNASVAPADMAALSFRPFGVSQDARPSALGCTPMDSDKPDSTGQYSCSSLPDANGLFDQYILAYVRDVGICNVVAVSRYLNDDQRGTTTREIYKEVASLLTEEFGPADEKVDHTASPRFAKDSMFRQAIISQDRQIFQQWANLNSKFPDAQSASVTVSGSAELGLAVYSIFRFADNDSCLTELERQTGARGDDSQ